MLAPLDLFFSLFTMVVAVMAVGALSWGSKAVNDSELLKFVHWVLGASIAFLFSAFTRVLELVAGGSVFGPTSTLISLISFFLGSFYIIRSAFVLRAIAGRRFDKLVGT